MLSAKEALALSNRPSDQQGEKAMQLIGKQVEREARQGSTEVLVLLGFSFPSIALAQEQLQALGYRVIVHQEGPLSRLHISWGPRV